MAKASRFVPVAVFVLNRVCRAQIFVPVMVATCVKMSTKNVTLLEDDGHDV